MARRLRVCFVCLGNICRSPTAEGVFRKMVEDAGLADRIEVDSAGTSAWHEGEPPDPRQAAAAARRGYRIAGRARRLRDGDLDRCDLLVAMDRENLARLRALAGPDDPRVRLLRDFDPASPPGSEVPDPYYGGPEGFDEVVRIVEAACRGLLEHLRREHGW